LDTIPIGQQIEVDPPEGDFVIADNDAEYIFIAGGIGITPYHSILLQLAHEQVNLKTRLLYANKDNNFVFKSDLADVTDKMSNLKIQYITEPNRIDYEIIQSAAKDFTDPYYFISGPEPMVEYFTTLLKENGINGNRIKSDYFPGYNWSVDDGLSSIN
jgi:ferredoxin-NADP reductase